MIIWYWILKRLKEKREKSAAQPSDAASAAEIRSGRPEDTGGEPDADAADQHSVTGTTPNETFVGRVAGDDPGYLETGAEKRADAETEDETGGKPTPPT